MGEAKITERDDAIELIRDALIFLGCPEKKVDGMMARVFAAARAEERERCAKAAEDKYKDPLWHPMMRNAGIGIASAIRQLEETDNG